MGFLHPFGYGETPVKQDAIMIVDDGEVDPLLQTEVFIFTSKFRATGV
jgi:hypothetical protein